MVQFIGQSALQAPNMNVDFSPISNALDGLIKRYQEQQETAATGNALMGLYGGITGAPGPGPSSMPETGNALSRSPAPNAAAAASYAANPAPQTSLSPDLLNSVRSSEGWMPKAQWDYKQYTNGYGTRATSPNEVIDKPEAERRLQSEVGKARAIVERFAPNAPEGVKNALTSLTYNAGGDWMKSGLGAAVQRGDYTDAQQRFLQYNKAGGQTLPGLVSRRQKEAQWFSNQGQQPTRVADSGNAIPASVMRNLATTRGTQQLAGNLIEDQYSRNNPTREQISSLSNQADRSAAADG
jgi:lysozyme